MSTPKKRSSKGESKIDVKLVDVTGGSIEITATKKFLGVAAVLPPPPPPLARNSAKPFTVVAYVGPAVGSTKVKIPKGWSQVMVVSIPDGLETPNLLAAINTAILASSSPPPGTGTGI